MIRTVWSRKKFALIITMVTLACAAGLMRPKPFHNSGLSADWQCSKTAGILITCTKNHT
jgi:hypothetical protein